MYTLLQALNQNPLSVVSGMHLIAYEFLNHYRFEYYSLTMILVFYAALSITEESNPPV